MTDNSAPCSGAPPGQDAQSDPEPEQPSDPQMAAIPRNIAGLQAFRGYTDAQMCEWVGIGEGAWKRRKTRPELWTYQQLARIAEVLDVDLARLTRTEP